MNTLRDTFIDALKDTYDAEHQIIKALPKVVSSAEHEDLKEALASHLDETRGHVERLEKVFQMFDESPKRKKCKGMEGLLAEGEEALGEGLGDAALIMAAQKVEHYEIAAYGSLIAWAKLLEEDDAVDILEETLGEETAADEKLTEIAESTINPEENEEEEAESVSRGKKHQG